MPKRKPRRKLRKLKLPAAKKPRRIAAGPVQEPQLPRKKLRSPKPRKISRWAKTSSRTEVNCNGGSPKELLRKVMVKIRIRQWRTYTPTTTESISERRKMRRSGLYL